MGFQMSADTLDYSLFAWEPSSDKTANLAKCACCLRAALDAVLDVRLAVDTCLRRGAPRFAVDGKAADAWFDSTSPD